MSKVTRRLFLQGLLSASAASAAGAAPLRFFKPLRIDNPLAAYPNRDWERVYRNIFHADSTFTFLCAPNDTHNCLLKAHVKNGVVVRIGPTFGYGKAKDLYGNTASHRWDPRLCQKGLALVRRIYGDRRVKAPRLTASTARHRCAEVGRSPVLAGENLPAPFGSAPRMHWS